MFLSLLLLAASGAPGDVVQVPVRQGVVVAARFVQAIRAGDAAGIRQYFLPPVADELRADQDRWIDKIAKTGPGLPDAQFTPLTQSLGMGNFAVVQGGFGPAPYMRLMKSGDAWEVLAPGDAKARYGLAGVQSATLARLKKLAVSNWGERPMAAQPRVQARVPLNSFAAPTSQPVASDGFYFSPATAAYFAILNTDNFNEQSPIARALVRAGDVASARQLIPFCDHPDDLRIAGLVAAYSSEPTIANAKRVRGTAQKYEDFELAFGLAAGLAMQGKHEAALVIANSVATDSMGRGRPSVRSVVLRHQPAKAAVDAYLREFPAAKLWPDEFMRVAEAVVLAGDDARVPEMLDLAMQRSRSVSDFRDEVRARMAKAYVAVGKRAGASELVGKITSARLLAQIEVEFAREPARRGDAQAVLECAKTAKHGRSDIMNLLVYAHARAGNTAAAQELCDQVARAARQDVRREFALRYGMLAAAQNDMGQKDQARATIERVTKLINDLPEPGAKRYAFRRLIMSAILGAEYYSYGAAFEGLW